MLPKGMGLRDRGVDKLGKVDMEPIICNAAGLFQACHAFVNLHVDPAVGSNVVEVVQQYNLHDVASNSWVYMEIRKGVPGLKQASRIANDRLQLQLAEFGYAPVARTLSLWKHVTEDITFSLVVNNFGVKYVGKENSDHLIQAL